MKIPSALLVLAFAFTALTTHVCAEDLGVMYLKLPREKKPQRVIITFDEAAAPETVANFKKLARKGFFKGIAFHRVFPGQLVQAGDPKSKRKDRANVGTGGPGYTLTPEIRRKHVAGTVAMARLPDHINPARRSNGSQFYVAIKPLPKLDGQYTVFGDVIEGLDVLEKVSQLPADSNDNPIDRAVIKSFKIIPRGKLGV